jgi:teichuronic acid biosynthesis glycosyltransferase TuaH
MHPAMLPLASRIVRRQLRGAVRRLGGDVHAVISTWLFIDAYGILGERRRVYWWRDDPVSAAELWGRSAKRLSRGDERLAAASDLIVAVNEDVARRWESRGFTAAFLPNGCDADFFADLTEAGDPVDVDLPRPIAGFVGHLNGRTDLSLLEAVADAGTSLLLIGPKDPAFEPERFDRLAGRPNVAYVGRRPFDQLRSYLNVIDVGLVPYADTPFNRRSFPIKPLEYLAAGLPVVATPLPAVRWLNTDFVALADSPDSFAASVARSVALAREPDLMASRRGFASCHSWDERTRRFADLLGLPGRSAPAPATP